MRSTTFHLPWAITGASVMGVLVFFGNTMSGIIPAIKAGFVQFALSFVIIGITHAIYARNANNKLLAVSLPATFSTIAASIIHYIAKTPEYFVTLGIVLASALIHFSALSKIHKAFGTYHPLRLAQRILGWFGKLKLWQYWSAHALYTFIGAIMVGLGIRYGMSVFKLVNANPGLPYGGMAIGSKYEVCEQFKGNKEYLRQKLIPKRLSTQKKIALGNAWMKKEKISFPVVAKPDKAYVGKGVRLINNKKELEELFSHIPSNYILQEYVNLIPEYGIMYAQIPGQKGRVVSLTRKKIPVLTGDGKSTVKTLIKKSKKLGKNKKALLKHCPILETTPKKGEKVQLILQASHTFGTQFEDADELITPQMERWIQRLCDPIKGLHIGRFDMKVPNEKDLQTGKGAKIIEFNGVMAEPISVYDDNHSFWVFLREFSRHYNRAFKIASHYRKRKVDSKKIYKEFRKLWAMDPKLYKLSDKYSLQ